MHEGFSGGGIRFCVEIKGHEMVLRRVGIGFGSTTGGQNGRETSRYVSWDKITGESTAERERDVHRIDTSC